MITNNDTDTDPAQPDEESQTGFDVNDPIVTEIQMAPVELDGRAQPGQQMFSGQSMTCSTSTDTPAAGSISSSVRRVGGQTTRLSSLNEGQELAQPIRHKNCAQSASAVNKEMMRSIGMWFQEEYEKSNACVTGERNEWVNELICVRGTEVANRMWGESVRSK